MNSAIVFFSHRGSTRRIAQILAQELDATIIELSVHPSLESDTLETYTWRTEEVVSPVTPAISYPEFNPDDYDLVILGSPVWSGTIAPALRSFLEGQEMFRQRIALYCCYERRVGNSFTDAHRYLRGNAIVDEARFCTIDDAAVYADAIQWARDLVERVAVDGAEETRVGRTAT